MGLNLDTNLKGYFLVGHGGGTVACAVAVVTPARVSRPLFLSDVDAGAHSCDRARAGNCPCSCRDGWGIKQGRHESFVLENHDIRYTASSKARALRAPQWLPMKITDVETIPLRLAEVRPNGDGLQDVLILRVHTDEGITGIGEAHTSPLVLKAIIDAPISQLTGQGLRQLLLGKDPLRINELWDLMYEHTSTFGRRAAVIHAMSGIDIALWDILGKVTGRPLYQLLGGARRDRVRVYASDLTPEDKTRVVPRAKELIDQGYTGVKFGWGTLGQNVREDARWVNELRRGVGPKVDLMVDMGAAISFGDALWLGNALAEDDVYFLEEPLSPDNLDGFAELVAASPTAIATGEKETTRFGFRKWNGMSTTPSTEFLSPRVPTRRSCGLSRSRTEERSRSAGSAVGIECPEKQVSTVYKEQTTE